MYCAPFPLGCSFDALDSFLNCEDGGKRPGRSVLKVGVEQALEDAGFDHQAFLDRGGIFEWSRDEEARTDTGVLDW